MTRKGLIHRKTKQPTNWPTNPNKNLQKTQPPNISAENNHARVDMPLKLIN